MSSIFPRETLYDKMNRPRTESMFLETFNPVLKGKYEPLFTMRPYDHKGCRSAYLIYMEAATEYDAAMQICADMRHWRKLCSLPWFMNGAEDGSFDGLRIWRKDKAELDATKALKLIRERAEKGNVSAQKILLDTANQVSKARVGRPEKQKDLTAEEARDAKIHALHKHVKAVK